jgi:transcriptional regulator with XRE-family HTH domain
MSRSEPARQAGVPVSTVRHWENGRGFPGVAAFLRLAQAMDVPAERLAEGGGGPGGGRARTRAEAAALDAKGQRRGGDARTIRCGLRSASTHEGLIVVGELAWKLIEAR